MKRRIICVLAAIVALSAAASSVVACSKASRAQTVAVASAAPRKAEAETPSSDRLVEDVNGFGIELLKTASEVV